jgi:hypothetical protein
MLKNKPKSVQTKVLLESMFNFIKILGMFNQKYNGFLEFK